jgi:hypothetical protein
MAKIKLHAAARMSTCVYFMFEFQPIAHAVPTGGSPRVERRGQIHEKSKVDNETSGKSNFRWNQRQPG